MNTTASTVKLIPRTSKPHTSCLVVYEDQLGRRLTQSDMHQNQEEG